MGIFFRLRNAKLGQAQFAEILAEDIFQLLVGEGHGDVGHGGVVLCGADEMQGEKPTLALELIKVGVHQGAGQLPGPVGAEIVEDDPVPGVEAALPGADHRLHELVGDSLVVGGLNGLQRIIEKVPRAIDHGVIGPLEPVPAAVPVHGVVPSHHIGDLSNAQGLYFLLELADIVPPRGGGDIPSIQKDVNIELFQTVTFGQLQQGIQMGDVAVDPAVGEQTHEMQGADLVVGYVEPRM